MEKNYIVTILFFSLLSAATQPLNIETDIQIISVDNAIAQGKGTSTKHFIETTESRINKMARLYYSQPDKELLLQLKNLDRLYTDLAQTFEQWYLQGDGRYITIVLPASYGTQDFDFKEYYEDVINIASNHVAIIIAALNNLKKQKPTDTEFQAIVTELYYKTINLDAALQRLKRALKFMPK